MLRSRQRLTSHGRTDSGFTMVEVLMSIVVFAIVAAAVAALLVRTLGLTQESRMRSSAANLAERAKEVSLGLGYDALIPGTTSNPMVIDGDAFTVERTISLLPGTSTASSCTAPDGSRLAYKKISVQVTWPTMGKVTPVRSDTVLAVPVGQVNGNLGAFALPLVDRDLKGVSGIPVKLSNGQTATTDRDGCAVFTGLTPGRYTATVDSAGYVGIDNLQLATSLPADVVADKIGRTADVQYDRAASLALSWDAPPGYVLPVSGQSVFLRKEFLNQSEIVAFCGGSVTTGCLTYGGALAPVFPFSGSGYGLSAGRCLNAAGKVNVAPEAGASTVEALAVGGVQLDLEASGGVAKQAALVTLERPVDAQCAGGDSLVVTESTTVQPSTPTSLKVAVPYGTWTIYLTDASGVRNSYGTVTISSTTRVAAKSVSF